jgi:hypothetical protein
MMALPASSELSGVKRVRSGAFAIGLFSPRFSSGRNSLEVRRYLTAQMYAPLLTQFLALWLVLEFAFAIRRQRSGDV